MISPRVISWYFVRTALASSSSVRVGRISPRDSCRRCTQRETCGEFPHLPLVSLAVTKTHMLSSVNSPMPNLSATPGRYQAGSTANFVTASSPESFLQILPSGTLFSQVSVTMLYRFWIYEGVACIALVAIIKGHPQSSFAHAVLQLGKLGLDQHESLPNLKVHLFTFICAFVMAMVGRISTAPRQNVSYEKGADPTYRPPPQPGL